MEGWLTKKGHRVNNWKRRWFELYVDYNAGAVRLRYYTNELKNELKGEHHITASTTVFGVPVDGPHKFCFKLVARGTKNSEELTMDADTPNLRLKWIMAIEALVLELKQQGGVVIDTDNSSQQQQQQQSSAASVSFAPVSDSSSSSATAAVTHTPNFSRPAGTASVSFDTSASTNSTSQDDWDSSNNSSNSSNTGVLFSALSSKKLSKAELQILEVIRRFVDCWMNGKHDMYNSAVTEEFTMTVSAGDYLVSAHTRGDCWELRSRAFNPALLPCYTLTSTCVLSSTAAIACVSVFDAKDATNNSPLEDYEVTFAINGSRDRLVGVEFNRIDAPTPLSSNAEEESPPAGGATNYRETVAFVSPSGNSLTDFGVTSKYNNKESPCPSPETSPESVSNGSPKPNGHQRPPAPPGGLSVHAQRVGDYSPLLQGVSVTDLDYLTGLITTPPASSSNPELAVQESPSSPSSTSSPPGAPVVSVDKCPGLHSWLRDSSSECGYALGTLLQWTGDLGLDRRAVDHPIVLKFAEYLHVPEYLRRLTKAELDLTAPAPAGSGTTTSTTGGGSGEDRDSMDDTRSSNQSSQSINTFNPSIITSQSQPSSGNGSNSNSVRGSVLSYRCNELVNISVQLPPSMRMASSLQSVTLNFAVPINNTVEQVLQMIFNKLKALGNPLPESSQAATILKCVGVADYLFRNYLPLYMYDCAVRCCRLQENLALLLYELQSKGDDDEVAALQSLRTVRISSIVSAHEEKYGAHTFNLPLPSAMESYDANKYNRCRALTEGQGQGGDAIPAPATTATTVVAFDEEEEDEEELMLEKDSSSAQFYVRIHGIQFPLLPSPTGTSGGLGHYIPSGFDSYHVEVSLYYNGDEMMEEPLTTSSVSIPAHVLQLNQSLAAATAAGSDTDATGSIRLSGGVSTLSNRLSSTPAGDLSLLTAPLDIRIPGGALSTSISLANIPSTARVVLKLMGNTHPSALLGGGPPVSTLVSAASVCVFDYRHVLNCSAHSVRERGGTQQKHHHTLGKRGVVVPLFEASLADRVVNDTHATATTSPAPGSPNANNNGAATGPNSSPSRDSKTGRGPGSNSNDLDDEDNEEDDEEERTSAEAATSNSPASPNSPVVATTAIKPAKKRKEKPKKMPPVNYASSPPGINLQPSAGAVGVHPPISLIVSFDWPTPGKLITCTHRNLLAIEQEAIQQQTAALMGDAPPARTSTPPLATVVEGVNEDNETETGVNYTGSTCADTDTAGEDADGAGGALAANTQANARSSTPSPTFARNPRRGGNAALSMRQQRRNVSVISKRAAAPTKVPTAAEWAIIDAVDRQDPLAELEPDAAMLLWDCRKSCIHRPSLLVKFLKSVWWTSATATTEARKMLLQWQPCPPIEALELLDIRFSDPVVREYAVQRLGLLTDDQLHQLMLQLVQTLKYEAYVDNPLARFLLRRALLRPDTIGHSLFWMLRAEMHVPTVRDRFGVYLCVYVWRVGVCYRSVLRQQIGLTDQLTAITVAIKHIAAAKRSEFASSGKSVFARECLTKLLPQLPPTFTLALNPKVVCSGINVSKCFVLSSKKMPLWVQFINADGMGLEYPIIFKVGDDLRQDQLTLQLIRIMDSLWRGEFDMGGAADAQGGPVTHSVSGTSLIASQNSKQAFTLGGRAKSSSSAPVPGIPTQSSTISRLKFMSIFSSSSSKQVQQQGNKAEEEIRNNAHTADSNSGLDLRMRSYGCVSTGLDTGFIEVVAASSTCANIQTDYGGKLTGAFANHTIIAYLKEANPGHFDYDLAVDNFARTCAGYCVATYVLGIGDRHGDNIMVSRTGHLFHIDFGHFLGNFKSFKGINRERNPFVFTPEMAQVLKVGPMGDSSGSSKGTPSGALYNEFEMMCCRAYNALRKRGHLLITLFALMIPAGMPELLKRSDIIYLRDMLSLELTDEQATEKFMREIKNCLGSISRRVDNWFHNLKHKT